MGESKLTLTLLEGEDKIYVKDARNVVETGYGDYLVDAKNMETNISPRDLQSVAGLLDRFGGQIPKKIEITYGKY